MNGRRFQNRRMILTLYVAAVLVVQHMIAAANRDCLTIEEQNAAISNAATECVALVATARGELTLLSKLLLEIERVSTLAIASGMRDHISPRYGNQNLQESLYDLSLQSQHARIQV